MKSRTDIAVIGAGPAGMAAAVMAADHGASVLLLDEQAAAGGQIYRAVGSQKATGSAILGTEYYQGGALVDRLAASTVEHVTGATVWHVSDQREIGVSVDGAAELINADHIIIATGAQERPFPVPGWTLPGVMNAGAAQILLKSSGVLLPYPVFVGTGPLLYLIAHQYLRAGVPIAAVLDTTPRSNLRQALGLLPAAFREAGQIWKGLGWLKDLRTSGTTFKTGVEDIRINGADHAESVEYKIAGHWHSCSAESVLLHQGVVPNVNLAMAAGCKHHWSDAQLCWHAQVDDWGYSTVEGVSITGDGAGIVGADSAQTLGGLAALDALYRIGKLSIPERDKIAMPLRKIVSRQQPLRRFLDRLYQPAEQFRIPADPATLVCRCEEVSAAEIREAVSLGCQGPNQLKSFTRAGMGPCQGRLCGLTVSAIIADELGRPVQDIGAARLRSPVKPLELGQLAALADKE